MSSSSSEEAIRETEKPRAPWKLGPRWRGVLLVVAAFCIMLTFVTFPFLPAPTQEYEADLSLSQILGHAYQHGLQFGTEHVYTYGPLGFLFFFFCVPELYEAHMLVDVVLCFGVAAGLLLVASRIGIVRGILLVAGFIWVAANNYIRTDLVLNTGLLCWGLLCLVESGRRLTLAVTVFTALAVFGALAKNSFLVVGVFSVVLLAGDLVVRGEKRRALGLAGGFVVGFLAGWMILGQSLRHVPAFVGNIVAMVRGYDGALGWEPPYMAGKVGNVVGVLLVLFILVRSLTAYEAAPRARWRRWLLLIWIAGFSFPAWKHGFVRAGEWNIEMCFGFFAVLTLGVSALPSRSATGRRWVTGLGWVCFALTLLPLQWLFFPRVDHALIRPFYAFAENLRYVINPGDRVDHVQSVLEASRAHAQLPQLRRIIGQSRVDVFGRRQAFAFYNGLNYHPRPLPQSYAVCNADLMRLNERFYLSAEAPDFVLFELVPMDRKLRVLEDSWVLRHLLINYEPVAFEGAFVLLKWRSAEPAQLSLVREGSAPIGQVIDLPEPGGGPLWLEIDLRPSWVGHLRHLLSRPTPIRLAAWDNGRLLVRNRAAANMLEGGFLARPFLQCTEDVLQLYSQAGLTNASGYSVEVQPADRKFWQENVRFRVYRIENRLGEARTPAAVEFLKNAGSGGEMAAGLAPASVSAPGRTLAAPFNLFRATRWRPGQPPPGNIQEQLAFLLFLILPLVAAGLLVVFARWRKKAATAARWPVVLLGNGIVLGLLFSLTLLAAECYFRFLYDTTDSLGYTRVCERWVQRHWHVNRAGCRDDIEYYPEIGPGKKRISFVGDSFTAGHGIDRVADRFPNRLREKLPGREIHVLANVGLDTGSEIKLLNRAVKQGYQLDEVVLVYCLNDVGDLLPPETDGFDQLNAELEGGPWFVRNSYAINLMYHRMKAAANPRMRDYFRHVAAAYQGPAWELQKERLKELRDVVHAHGGRLSVVTFPFLHALGPGYNYRFAHENMAEAWRALGVPHLDLLPVYEGIASEKLVVNRYDAHPNEYANELAAEAVEEFLGRLPGT